MPQRKLKNMKKLLTIVAILFSFNVFAQAENVTITPQARDLEFIATDFQDDRRIGRIILRRSNN
jgi:hypothetical protein